MENTPLKDSKGNVIVVGTKLRSTQSKSSEPQIECTAINGDVATFYRLRISSEPFRVDRKNLLSSLWIVC